MNIEETMNSRVLPRIVLIACGSFSPPTPMHFRMFEIARDHFEKRGTHRVVAGIVSPTHDAYAKKGLAPGTHRGAMAKLALQSSSWIRVSDWEIQQPGWSRTKSVLQYHQNYMNNYINSGVLDDANGHIPAWLPPGLREQRDPVQLKLLCGADLLESFAVPGLWSDEDIEDIVANHGLVVISRNGANPEKFIFESDILTKHEDQINLITNWVSNEVSSTMIRRLLSRGQSVKYSIDDLVLEYTASKGLYNCKSAPTEEKMNNSLLPRIVLIACGSFSPPTPMHFRMFEIARDHFEKRGTHRVVGGIVSPTHDAYAKKGLAPGTHRGAMAKLALQSSSWIRVSDWEIQQPGWSRTKSVLQYHQNYMNNYINSGVLDDANGHIPAWLPPGLREQRDPVQLKLLCGADLLESFAVPGLWSDEDIEDIVANHGLVVISRSGANPEKFIFETDILTKYQRQITLITNWVSNEVSSTMIRRLLSRGQSVKYLIDELVLEYIASKGLYGSKSKYLSELARQLTTKNVYNLEFINQVNMSASNTPSDNEGEDGAVEELMDETDYSIKNILTSINLDNRKSKVFCCGNNDNVASKLAVRNRPAPGQAVQVITTERGITKRMDEGEELKPKKMKITAAQNV